VIVPFRTPGPLLKAIAALFADLKDREDYDPARFGAKLDALRNTLKPRS